MWRGLTAREEVEIAVSDEAGLVLGVLLPDGKHLDIFDEGEDGLLMSMKRIRTTDQGAKSRP